jgi:hypothetical protein
MIRLNKIKQSFERLDQNVHVDLDPSSRFLASPHEPKMDTHLVGTGRSMGIELKKWH